MEISELRVYNLSPLVSAECTMSDRLPTLACSTPFPAVPKLNFEPANIKLAQSWKPNR